MKTFRMSSMDSPKVLMKPGSTCDVAGVAIALKTCWSNSTGPGIMHSLWGAAPVTLPTECIDSERDRLDVLTNILDSDDVDIRVLFLSLLSGGATLTPKPHKKPPSFLYFVFLHPQTIVFWMGGKETKSTRKIRKWFSDKSAVKTDLATRNGRHQSHSLQRVLVPSLCV
jgi:hypothetical protein